MALLLGLFTRGLGAPSACDGSVAFTEEACWSRVWNLPPRLSRYWHAWRMWVRSLVKCYRIYTWPFSWGGFQEKSFVAGMPWGVLSLSHCPGDPRRPWYRTPPLCTEAVGTHPLCLSPSSYRVDSCLNRFMWWLCGRTRTRVHEWRLPACVFQASVLKFSLCGFFEIKITSSFTG